VLVPKSLFDDPSDSLPVETPQIQPAQRLPLHAIETPLPQPARRAPLQSAQRAPLQPAPRSSVHPARAAQTSTSRSAKPPTPGVGTNAKSTADSSAESTTQLVKDEFRVRFRRQLLLIAIMLPAIWAARLDSPKGRSTLEIMGLAVIFVGVTLTFINWRCPSCNRYLYRRIYPRTCPGCGVTFHD
jgi:hypothetical protein